MKAKSLLMSSSFVLLVTTTFLWAQEAPPASGTTPEKQTNGAPKAKAKKKDKPKRKAPEGPFLAKPYVQLGHSQEPGKVIVLWHTSDVDAPWTVEYKTPAEASWHFAKAPSVQRIAVAGIEPHRVYHTAIKGLHPGEATTYRVSKAGAVVFQSEAHAPKAADQGHRFVVFGDCGVDGPEQASIAFRTFQAKPDLVMITGDIVYDKGLASEYRENFWPIYNADTASPSEGAPLLRSTLFVSAPGNHDIASRDLGKVPDGMAYFYYWFQPLNGPVGLEGGPLVAPVLGPEASQKAFRDAAGKAFPRMANFSFDYGNAHWTVLDANATVNWTDRELQQWVANDLAAAKGATWRFVSFHQPGFSSSKTHFDEQYMRILSPVFEAGKVDLVFNGHVHNYQRTYPMKFVPAEKNNATPTLDEKGKLVKNRHVDGKWTLDKSFNGQSDTTPEGVIYVVTGAGGQHLYNPEQQDDPASWQEFTLKHISKVHSLTVADVDGPTLTIRQLTADGEEVDRFVVTK
jgi:3',5'-cyclic AMP phosphodiesterase CpdA